MEELNRTLPSDCPQAPGSRGLFITLEGTEGCGKTTQSRLLAESMGSWGRKVVQSREPGGTRIGGMLRKIVLDPANKELCYEAEALLYAADRAQHIRELVLPALEAGADVICDRYVDSSLAYQGAGGKLGSEWVAKVNELATGGLSPDMTILLDCPPEVGLSRRSRAAGQFDRIEQRELEYHSRVRECFLSLAAVHPHRMVKISIGDLGVREVHKAILTILTDRYPFISPSGRVSG